MPRRCRRKAKDEERRFYSITSYKLPHEANELRMKSDESTSEQKRRPPAYNVLRAENEPSKSTHENF